MDDENKTDRETLIERFRQVKWAERNLFQLCHGEKTQDEIQQ